MKNENESTALALTFEKCREITNCLAGVDLQDHLRLLAAENVALALENVALKQIVDSVTNLDNEPHYHAEGMGCGLEDRGITDRYDACRYGWDEAMERVYGEVIPCADELDFSSTDRIYAGIKADAFEEAAVELETVDTIASTRVIAFKLREFAKQLREGAK